MIPGPAPQYSPGHEHLESTGATIRIREARAGSSTLVPAWPAGLIQPSSGELLRWFELWGHPLAASWADMGRERMVADLVRLEVRVRHPLATDDYVAELDHLRCELGLSADTGVSGC